MRASDTVQTFFDEVKVPVRYTIGQPGSGFIYQMQQFQEERLWAGAGTLMGCDRIINATIDYTRERKVFGQPLLDNQVDPFPPGRAQERGRGAALAGLSRLRGLSRRHRTSPCWPRWPS